MYFILILLQLEYFVYYILMYFCSSLCIVDPTKSRNMKMSLEMHLCMCLFGGICVYAFVCMCVCKCVCMCVCVSVCVCVCVSECEGVPGDHKIKDRIQQKRGQLSPDFNSKCVCACVCVCLSVCVCFLIPRDMGLFETWSICMCTCSSMCEYLCSVPLNTLFPLMTFLQRLSCMQ